MPSSSGTPPDTIMVSDPSTDTPEGAAGGNANIPKPKRLACMICRKRKLKCDGIKPSCSTCTRLGHNCAYDEIRRKSGPKRGYVKALEERLKQVETLLQTHDVAPTPTAEKSSQIPGAVNGVAKQSRGAAAAVPAAANFTVTDPSIGIASSRDMDRWHFNAADSPQNGGMDNFDFNSNSIHMSMNNVGANFTWEMVGLGLEEPLPPQETIDELHQIYFEKIHPSCPMIHKYRYLAAMNLAPNQRPPVCLRYAMWTLACSVTEKYADLRDLFYQRARKYVESDYMKGYGEHMISVAHAQTHTLLASYEFKMMYFPRAWMSTGSAIRLCQMTGLHRLDGAALDVKQCLPEPRDWTEREERRRTFWMAFSQDRYASIGTGWPMTVNEKDIMSNLPCSEDAFEMSRPEQTSTLAEALTSGGAAKLSSFGAIVLMACLFGRNLNHLHRPDEKKDDDSMNGEFWKRHRNLDNILLNTALSLPSHLKLPDGLSNPNVIFSNMCIHTSTICLHQAAIFKADKARMPGSASAESKIRCISAANEIASIMRMISHLDLASMNPFISFCLYVSARVFIQYLKSKADDSSVIDSLRFLLSAMNALKRRNPLTESFLVQLDVDLEVLGARTPMLKDAFPRSTDSPSSPKTMFNGDLRAAPCQPSSGESGQPDNSVGIMAYRNECHFLKTVDDDANAANGPDLTDTDPSPGGMSEAPSSSTGLPSRVSWGAGHDPSSSTTSLPTREHNSRGTIPYSAPLQGLVPPPGYSMDPNSPNAMSGTSGDTGPTPGSSSASDTRQTQHLAPGQAHDCSGRTPSFKSSPQSQAQSDMEAAAAAAAAASAFFDMQSPQFGLGTGLTPRFGMEDTSPGNDFSVPGSWEDMAGTGTGMTPVPDAGLRGMMNMGPMDTMDLGWDAETSLPR